MKTRNTTGGIKTRKRGNNHKAIALEIIQAVFFVSSLERNCKETYPSLF